ncbi:MAG: hypothetical protein AB8F34_11155 [Akkermansiaceae bacterium]
MNKISGKIWWFFGGGIFLLLLLVTWQFGGKLFSGLRSSDEFVLRKPIAEVKFDDDFVLKILQMGENAISDGSFKSPGFGSTSSGTSSYASIKTSYHIVSDKLTGIKFTADEGSLILQIQLSDPYGEAVPHDVYLQNGRVNSRSKHMRKLARATTIEPEVTLQMRDLTGGWITASGPGGSDEDLLHRSAVTFRGWSRDQKEFVFRAKRGTNIPKEFRIKNPYFTTMPAIIPTASLPQTQTDPDFSITLSKVEESLISGQGRMLKSTTDFKSRFPEKERQWGQMEINHTLTHVTDPMGGIHGAAHSGTYYPAHIKQATFHYVIEKGTPYPRKKSDTVIFAEAVVSADGKRMKLTKTHRLHGIESVTLGKIGVRDGHKFCSVEIAGKWNSEAEKNAAHVIFNGEIRDCHLVGFEDTATESSGYSDDESSGTSSSFGKYEFDVKKTYFNSFKPGQTIHFGYIPSLKPISITFTADLPTASVVKPYKPQPVPSADTTP